VVFARPLDPLRFWINDRAFKLVKLSEAETSQDGFNEEKAKSILMKGRRGLHYLVEREDLMIHKLSRLCNFSVNVYYLPLTDEGKSIREEIRLKIESNLQ
jgi:hypothetical protein